MWTNSASPKIGDTTMYPAAISPVLLPLDSDIVASPCLMTKFIVFQFLIIKVKKSMKSLPMMFLLLVFIVSGCSKSTSLSDCPDCGQTVSVRAAECPHCGGPLSQDVTLNIVDRAWSSDVDPDGNPVRLTFQLTSHYPDPPDPLTTADFEGINRLLTVRAL